MNQSIILINTNEVNTNEIKSVGRPRKYEKGLSTDYINQSNYNQNYYQKNKEKAKEKYLEKKNNNENNIIKCSCGRSISSLSYSKHLKTKLHQRFLLKNNNESNSY